MTAFTKARNRETRLFGTGGEIYCDGRIIQIFDFLIEQTEAIGTNVLSDGSILSGHGGGCISRQQCGRIPYWHRISGR
jgi:hypothetical protein